MTTRYAARRAGFTLIELLVVILIIAVLAGLLLAGLGAARTSAKKAQATTEIAQIGNAAAAFKAKFNTGFIPAFRPGMTDGSRFRLRKTYQTTDPEFAYLTQLFPSINAADNGLPAALVNDNPGLTPNQVLTFFLTGVNQQGFSTNRTMPFTPPTGNDSRTGPFLDVSASRIVNGHYVDPWGVPYAYFAFDPGLNAYPHNNNRASNRPGEVVAPFLTWPDNTIQVDGTAIAPNGVQAYYAFRSLTEPVQFLNQKGFQIISAGPDQVFGRGGNWVPGQDDYVSNAVGGDDISNFNQGSLNQRNQ